MHRQQAGFTLIELVMVIVILGILAAFALPKFADLTGDARAASINGLAGAIKSAAAIARAQQLADGLGLNSTVKLDGQNVAMTAGYPQAATNGIMAAATINANTSGTNADYKYIRSNSNRTMTFEIGGYASSTCRVAYTQATTTGNPPTINTAYTVTVNTSGC